MCFHWRINVKHSAHYCRDHMAEAVASHPKINTDPKKAIFDAFLHLDDKYCELSSKYNLDDGATGKFVYHSLHKWIYVNMVLCFRCIAVY